MRLYEFFNDHLNEMAKSRAEVRSNTEAQRLNIVEHLIKIKCIDSPQTINHWTTEINSWIYPIASAKLKPDSKPVEAATLYGWLGFEDMIAKNPSFIDDTVDEMLNGSYSTLGKINYDSSEVEAWIKDILKKISIDVGKKKFAGVQNYI